MPAPTLLFLPGASEKVAALAIKCLAVAGAFMVGYVVGWLLAWGLDRWAFARKSPDPVKKAVRTLAGIATAILVALIVFGDGTGGGLFGGGGQAEGTGTGTAPSAETPGKEKKPAPPITQPTPKAPPPKVEPIKTPEVKPTDVVVRVTFLGGADVTGDRFYLLDEDPGPKTFAQVQEAVVKRIETAEGRKVYLAVQFPARNRIAEDSINVTQVTDWARNRGIEVLWPGKR